MAAVQYCAWAGRSCEQLDYGSRHMGLGRTAMASANAMRAFTTSREKEREVERFTTSIQPAWLMRTGLCSDGRAPQTKLLATWPQLKMTAAKSGTARRSQLQFGFI